MSDVTLELLNRRAALAAVRQEAARIGADGDALLDSKKLYGQVTALDPDEPGFTGRVRELVGEAAGRSGGRPAASPPPDKQDGPSQWTDADIDASSPAELQAAMEAGLLVDLGFPPSKRGR